MNHPSEWARFFDENTGRYRYKHKGSGVISDTFMTIDKVLKNPVKNVAKKTAEKATKKSLKNQFRELVNLLLKKVRNKYEKYCKREKNKNRCCQKIRKRNLKIFCKTKHRIRRRPYKIKSNFGKQNLIEENFFF